MLFRSKTQRIYPLSTLVSRHTGIDLPANKAIVGSMAFTHESGIHAHGVLRNARTYEPVPPEMVGRTRRIVLGKHSGSASVEASLTELGYTATSEQLAAILARVKKLGDEGKRVTDADVMAIADTVLQLVCTPVISMRQFTVVSGNRSIPTASVTMVVNGVEKTGAATGNGPVDAVINALQDLVSGVADIQLEDYHVDAITGGADALVDVTVKLRKDGKEIGRAHV